MGIVMRAQGATTKAFPVRTVEEEQRSDRAQDRCALRVAAARGHLRCWLASTMCIDIPSGSPPSIWPRGARNAAPSTSTTDCMIAPAVKIRGPLGGPPQQKKRASRYHNESVTGQGTFSRRCAAGPPESVTIVHA